jgi:hypothetical protein
VEHGYQIYHHSFVFDRSGRWAVVQQGMNPETGWARRYHWLSETVADFVDEPHSEVIYGEKASFRDPARFSFAHGGKDGHPYPVDRQTYDQSIHLLKEAIQRARLGERDRLDALKRLNQLVY